MTRARRSEGGDQERELAQKYRKWGKALQVSHPFVAAKLVMELANTYDRDASREDTEAGIRRRLRWPASGPACRTTNAIDLRALDRHRNTAVTSLIPALSCRSCRPNAPFAELVRLSRTSIADEMREEHRRRVVGDRP
jgi:hypothetical protein